MIRPVTARVMNLGNLEPVDYKHIPFLDAQWPYRVDRNVLGAPLRVDGQLYRRGIGMHSTARIAYDIPPECDRFQVEVGIDDQAGNLGSVVFSIYLERQRPGKPGFSWERVAFSPVMRGGQGIHRMRVSLGMARRLALVAESSDRGDQRDLANWLDPRFLKSRP